MVFSFRIDKSKTVLKKYNNEKQRYSGSMQCKYTLNSPLEKENKITKQGVMADIAGLLVQRSKT